MYCDAYESYKTLMAKYEQLVTRAVELIKAANSENDELAEKLIMAEQSIIEKDKEIAMLRRDLARKPIGRDNW